MNRQFIRSCLNLVFGTALAAIMLATLGCTNESTVESAAGLDSPQGYTGRIRLTRFLDEPDGYCLDVPGPAHAVMLQFSLVAHTCHVDPLADQVFAFNVGNAGRIRWTTDEHDLCFTADSVETSSALNLRACDQPGLQSFTYTDSDEFRLNDSELCIHVERTGPVMRNPAAEGQDPYGRGIPVNPQYSHLMRRLELQPCGVADPAMSRWRELEG